jgi:hypothetical protein
MLSIIDKSFQQVIYKYFTTDCSAAESNPLTEQVDPPLVKAKRRLKASTDPLSCEHVACADKLSVFKKAMEDQKLTSKTPIETSSEKSQPSTLTTELPVAIVEKKDEKAEEPTNANDCPLDRNELGLHTWSLLHSLAAYFPDNPTTDQEEHARRFFEALAVLYPCKICAVDFQESIQVSPPRYDRHSILFSIAVLILIILLPIEQSPGRN